MLIGGAHVVKECVGKLDECTHPSFSGVSECSAWNPLQAKYFNQSDFSLNKGDSTFAIFFSLESVYRSSC